MKRLILIGLSALRPVCLPERIPPAKQPDTELLRLHGASRSAQVDAAMARDMISAYRGNNGLGRLTLDPGSPGRRAGGGRRHGPRRQAELGRMPSRRASPATGFAAPAANLSAGYHTLAEAFSGWRESPQHNRVLLDPKATRIGIATAYAPNSKYKVYWALAVAADRR